MTETTVSLNTFSVGKLPTCAVCNARDWAKAAPKEQAKTKQGFVRIRCKACERTRAALRRLKHTDKDRALVNEASKAWAKANPAAATAKAMLRHTAKLKRTPLWVDLNAVKQVYLNCPPGFVVDHVIPLQGTTVSGLHVAGNLQYLTPKQNSSKRNIYEVF